jgi:hypothetical protein
VPATPPPIHVAPTQAAISHGWLATYPLASWCTKVRGARGERPGDLCAPGCQRICRQPAVRYCRLRGGNDPRCPHAGGNIARLAGDISAGILVHKGHPVAHPDRVTFVHQDASGYVASQPCDIAACVGATWIGGGARRRQYRTAGWRHIRWHPGAQRSPGRSPRAPLPGPFLTSAAAPARCSVAGRAIIRSSAPGWT